MPLYVKRKTRTVPRPLHAVAFVVYALPEKGLTARDRDYLTDRANEEVTKTLDYLRRRFLMIDERLHFVVHRSE